MCRHCRCAVDFSLARCWSVRESITMIWQSVELDGSRPVHRGPAGRGRRVALRNHVAVPPRWSSSVTHGGRRHPVRRSALPELVDTAPSQRSRTRSNRRSWASALYHSRCIHKKLTGIGRHDLRLRNGAVRTSDSRLKKHRITLGCGRIARVGGRRRELIHTGFGVVVDDRCRLVLVGHRDLLDIRRST